MCYYGHEKLKFGQDELKKTKILDSYHLSECSCYVRRVRLRLKKGVDCLVCSCLCIKLCVCVCVFSDSLCGHV